MSWVNILFRKISLFVERLEEKWFYFILKDSSVTKFIFIHLLAVLLFLGYIRGWLSPPPPTPPQPTPYLDQVLRALEEAKTFKKLNDSDEEESLWVEFFKWWSKLTSVEKLCIFLLIFGGLTCLIVSTIENPQGLLDAVEASRKVPSVSPPPPPPVGSISPPIVYQNKSYLATERIGYYRSYSSETVSCGSSMSSDTFPRPASIPQKNLTEYLFYDLADRITVSLDATRPVLIEGSTQSALTSDEIAKMVQLASKTLDSKKK